MTDQARPKPIRQRFNVATGWAGCTAGVALFAGSFSKGHPNALTFVAVALACLSFCVMARPSLASSSDGLFISNVVREVTLPWEGISHATSRGTLVVHDTEGGRTTVWAVGSQKAVPRADSDAGVLRPGRLRPMPGTLAAPQTSAAALREQIDAEVIDNPPGPSGRHVRWLPLPCVLMAVALVSLVTAMVI